MRKVTNTPQLMAVYMADTGYDTKAWVSPNEKYASLFNLNFMTTQSMGLKFYNKADVKDTVETTENRFNGTYTCKGGLIPILQNDLTLGKVRMVLNFSGYDLVFHMPDGSLKLFPSMEYKEQLQHYRGCVVIMEMTAHNTIDLVAERTGVVNYMDAMLYDAKTMNVEKSLVYREVVQHLSKLYERNDEVFGGKSNSIKVVTGLVITADLFTHDEQVLLSAMDNILISTDLSSVTKVGTNPYCKDNIDIPAKIKDVSKEAVTVYIVDNRDMIGDRFYNLAGEVRKIPKIKDGNLVDGLYFLTDGSSIDNKLHTALHELDKCEFIYKSVEDAVDGSNLTMRSKAELERLKMQMDSERLAEEAKHRRELLDLEAKRQADKLEYERMLNDIKFERERELSDMDMRSRRYKHEIDEIKYVRESNTEMIKTVGAAMGVLSGIYLGIQAFNRN